MIKPSRSRNVQIDKYLSVHVVRISRILRFVDSLKLPPKSKALDVGCYPPLIFNSLRQRHFDTSGVTHFGRSDKSKKIYLVNIDVNPLPFPDGFFDLVIFTEIIEHLTNPFFALSEIRRVLKPGGWLLITTPNVSRSQNVIKLIFN